MLLRAVPASERCSGQRLAWLNTCYDGLNQRSPGQSSAKQTHPRLTFEGFYNLAAWIPGVLIPERLTFWGYMESLTLADSLTLQDITVL